MAEVVGVVVLLLLSLGTINATALDSSHSILRFLNLRAGRLDGSFCVLGGWAFYGSGGYSGGMAAEGTRVVCVCTTMERMMMKDLRDGSKNK